MKAFLIFTRKQLVYEVLESEDIDRLYEAKRCFTGTGVLFRTGDDVNEVLDRLGFMHEGDYLTKEVSYRGNSTIYHFFR